MAAAVATQDSLGTVTVFPHWELSELGALIVYANEHGPADIRGLTSSSAIATGWLGLALAELVGSVLRAALTAEQMVSWGWRRFRKCWCWCRWWWVACFAEMPGPVVW